MPKRFYVTTPIYYVNDKPHLGHVYTTVAADVLARHRRLNGDDVFFLTGTDEHGQKAADAAKKTGQSVQQHVDFHSKIFQNLWQQMNVSNDYFVRTTDEQHKKVVANVLQTLFDNGEIYTDSYKGWYCVPDERFWTEKDLQDGNCPECNRQVQKIEEKNYFFKMGKHQQWLIDHINSNPDFICPESRRNEVLGFLAQKLGDLCISRPKSRMSWGIELPFDADYVAYVWFDALLNYLSATGYLSGNEEQEASSASTWPADFHLIGKDILTTHSVYWMTMLHAMNMPLPKRIFAHGWWTVNGKKMSKSLGNALDPILVSEAVGLDAFRYFILREVPFGLDGDFNVENLITRVNVDLANNLGNLLSRTTSMMSKYRDGILPEAKKISQLEALKEEAGKVTATYEKHLAYPEFHKALEEVIRFCDVVNRFITEMEPWALAKDEAKAEELDSALYGMAEALRLIARMLLPFMPDTAGRMLTQLGLDEGCGGKQWGGIKAGTKLIGGEALFPRIDEKAAAKIKEKLCKKELPVAVGDGLIGIDEFSKVELRTGVVLEAENIKKSDRLLKLQVDMGDHKRQIVAGVAEFYKPEDLIGSRVVVVANLKPVKLMGIESQGMLLAAKDESRLTLINVPDELNGGLKVS